MRHKIYLDSIQFKTWSCGTNLLAYIRFRLYRDYGSYSTCILYLQQCFDVVHFYIHTYPKALKNSNLPKHKQTSKIWCARCLSHNRDEQLFLDQWISTIWSCWWWSISRWSKSIKHPLSPNTIGILFVINNMVMHPYTYNIQIRSLLG